MGEKLKEGCDSIITPMHQKSGEQFRYTNKNTRKGAFKMYIFVQVRVTWAQRLEIKC